MKSARPGVMSVDDLKNRLIERLETLMGRLTHCELDKNDKKASEIRVEMKAVNIRILKLNQIAPNSNVGHKRFS